MTESSTALSAGTAAVPSTATLAMLDRLVGSTGTTGSAREASSPLRATTARALAKLAPATADGEPDPLDANAAVAWLNEQVFTDANSLGNGVFQVPASLVCQETVIDDQGTETVSIDAQCAQDLATAQLRVHVTANGDELDFAIQVGANHDEPFAFALAHTKLALTVDLGETADAIVALAPLFGEDVPNLALAGRVTAAVEVLGSGHAKASLSIDEAVSIRVADAGVALDGAEAFKLTSAAAHVLGFEFDAPAKVGSASIALGATLLYSPEDHSQLVLPGVTGTAALAEGQPLALTNLSLGTATTTFSVAGVQAFAIDLNPDHGRKLDAVLTGDPATGESTLAVAPRLDLRMVIDHAALGDEREVYDVTRVLLDGSLRGSDATDQVQVVSGTFAITTDPAQYGVSAAAGQCVSSADAVDATTGSYYTQWSAGACL